MGYCIGGCFAGKLLQRAPDRAVAAVFCQSVGHLLEDPIVMYRHSKENWMTDFMKRRPEVSSTRSRHISTTCMRFSPTFCPRVARLYWELPNADARAAG